MNLRRVETVKIAARFSLACAVLPLIGCSKSPESASNDLNRSTNHVISSIPEPPVTEPPKSEPPATGPPATEPPKSELPKLEPSKPDPPKSTPPIPESRSKKTETDASQEVTPEVVATPSEPSFRMLLPTTSGPLVVDVEIRIGDQPLEAAFDDRILAVMDEARGDSSDLTWTSLFDHVAADPQQFGRSSPINSQQHRDLIRRYDRNRNKKPDHDEVTKFLFRSTRFAGPFRLVGSDYFREINRSQSAVFAAMDRNDDSILESDEVDSAGESLRRLDQNADERIDLSEITSVPANDDPAWKNRRSRRWGNVAMDLSGYIDWPMLCYTLDEMSRGGPFGRQRNALVKLDRDNNDSIDPEETRDLLSVEADLRLRVRYPLATTGHAEIELISISSDLDPLVKHTASTNQVRISGSSLRLIASAADVRNEGMIPKAPIWNVQVRARGAETPDGVFSWLDQNQDHFLSTREIDAAEDRLRAIASPDGNVKPSDIPDSFLVQFGRGDPAQDEQLFALAPPQSDPMETASKSWPRWAQSMDTNQDGEISRHEFPGRSQQFDDLDNNADDFIDIDELSAISTR